MTRVICIGSVVSRVDDLQRQPAFWTAVLDYVPRESDGDDFALLRPPSGGGPNLSLDRAQIERLKGLGVPWSRRPPDADYVILADPEGNRFCVIDAGPRA